MKPKTSAEQESVSQPSQRKLDKNSSSFVPGEPEKKPKTAFLSIDKPDRSNLIESLNINYTLSIDEKELETTLAHIHNLRNKSTRDEAFKQLNNRREADKNLAVLLWHSVGTIALILQEIIMIYPMLNSTTFSQTRSDKISNVLGLFQCLALDSRTRIQFLKSVFKSQSAPIRVPFHQLTH